jgi:WS/DGAT/MGAT family acyltransferase
VGLALGGGFGSVPGVTGHCERLSATDLVFLELEDANVSMHIGALCIFEGRGLLGSGDGLDMRRMRGFVAAALASNPRFRQRLAYVPLLEHPVWVDAVGFDLDAHVRHARLRRPGGERELRRLASRVMEERLDRGRPLWEMWFVDGLAERRVALLAKFHHCMIDGIAGVGMLASLLRLDRGRRIPPPPAWTPRAAPSEARLLADELARRAVLPFDALRGAGELLADPRHALDTLGTALHDLGAATGANATVASDTPLNVAVGPRRSFAWTRLDLDAVKAVKQRLGGTINDVVLAVVAGAVGRHLRAAGVDPGGLDFRITMPANVRAAGERGEMGNRVGVLTIPLPIAEPEPRQRLRTVVDTTQRLKQSGQLHGVEMIAELSDRLFPPLAGWLAWAAARTRMYNLSVTNVPGPQVPVYLLGARMLAIYPLAFLFSNQALTIALLSYDGGLHWALTADPAVIPDLDAVLTAIRDEFERLRAAGSDSDGSRGPRKATGPAPAAPPRGSARRR